MGQARCFSDGAEEALSVVFSLSGLQLTPDEKALFRQSNPLGFILFARNCESPGQLRRLTDDLKNSVGRDCPVLIDQEGGRVQRLRPPNWREYPSARFFGDRALDNMDEALDALRFKTLQLSEELLAGGINVNCDPVLDVARPETHAVIGDRAFSEDPAIVARLALSVCRHYLAAGITPVIKHMPGHGRATADSHETVPVVHASFEELAQSDFMPFRDIAASDVGLSVWGMPSPVLYPAIDPVHPACASRIIIDDVIRGHMGFQGVLVSDALDMGGFAAYGDAASRVRAVLDAGCDIALYCPGKLEEMHKIAESDRKIRPETLIRLKKAAGLRKVAA